MYATERHQLIEQLIATEGRVSVLDLARRFDVTTETIRRDLDRLEASGIVQRVHGGAVARARMSTVELSLAERTRQAADAKRHLARRALDSLPPSFGGSIYLDAGTTVAVFARLLALRAAKARTSIEVVTHSMTIAHLLSDCPGLHLTAIGGRVRGLTAAAVGATAVAAISSLRPDVAFVGTNGLSAGFGLSTPDPDEAAVKRAIVAAARRVIVLAHAEKFDTDYLVTFARLGDMDVLATDTAPGGELAAALSEAEVEVWVP